ncbi:hypothetical protein [Lysinibacillus sp. NPDC056220]|uniref:hypothetical protein n=1 Tax=Lysinibacillus sp. NPDC056220 TaxID=3398580 RepID=UPI003BF4D9AD
MSKTKWRIIEFINQSEHPININNHLNIVGLQAKFTSDDIAILNYEENVSSEVIELLKKSMIKEIIDNDMISLDLDEEDLFILNSYSCEEIMFSFCVNEECKSEEMLLNFLTNIGEISEYDYEHNHFERYEYSNLSKYPLFHNIRLKNIAIFHVDSLECGIALIGYMLKGNKMHFTIKAFQYEVLEYIINKFKIEYPMIELVDNLLWNLIMSRKVLQGYRPTDSYLINNPLSQQFLKTSKSSKLADKFEFILKELLNKGFLKEEEYLEVSKDSSITKFLHPYLIYNKNSEGRIWFGESTGLVYSESDKTNPKKITPLKLERVYAPHHDLLYYIRAFWHQNFIEQAIEKIKSDWDDTNHLLRIIDIVVDYKFDFLSETKPSKESRDIDCLIRVKNIRNNEEYIISIEAKRNSDEYNNVINDNRDKISSTYAKAFTAFVMVSYFNIGVTNNKEIITWEDRGEQVKKEIFPCVEHKFAGLVNSLKYNLHVICGIEEHGA